MADIYPHRVYDASPPEIAKCQKIAAATRNTAHSRQALSVAAIMTRKLMLPPNPVAAAVVMIMRITADIMTMRTTTTPA
jgi:hypothetical protein